MRSTLIALLLLALPMRAAAPVPRAFTISWYWETGEQRCAKLDEINRLIAAGWTVVSVDGRTPDGRSITFTLTPPKP